MNAQYDFFPTPQPKGSNKKRFHARLVVGEHVTTDEVVKLISTRCSLSQGDVRATLTELSEVLEWEIKDGNSVCLDGIGTFRGSAKSPSVRSVKEIRAESIRFGGIVYRPDTRLEKRLMGMKFQKAASSHRSELLTDVEIDGLLADYFQDHESITTRAMSALCGLRLSTALRRLKQRVAEGRLRHPGYRQAPFYYPVSGCYPVYRHTGEEGESSEKRDD